MTPNNNWHQIQNLLVIRLDSIGDILMTTPACKALKETYPKLHITLLCSEVGCSLSPFLAPYIDDVITFNAPWIETYASPNDNLELVERLKHAHFDAVVIFTVYSQNPLPAALITYSANIPLRLAYSRENPYHLLTNWIPDPEPQCFIRHEVERQLALVGTIGAKAKDKHLYFQVQPEDRSTIQHFLHQHQITKPWFILHPGAREVRRRYPIDQLNHILHHLQVQGACIITGSRNEITLSRQIHANNLNCINAVGKFSLGEFAALIEAAPFVVTNNTGTAHIAAAVDTPVIDLYAAANLNHTPWEVVHKTLYFSVPCKQCERGICPGNHHKPPATNPIQISKTIQEFIEYAKS